MLPGGAGSLVGGNVRMPTPGSPDVILGHHRWMRRQVAAWVDGELAGRAAAEVRRHLDVCWGCSGDAELLRLLKGALGALGEREPAGLAAMRLRRWGSQLGAHHLG